MKIILSAFVSCLLAATSSLANYTISIPTGIHPIANLLDNGGNTLQEVLPGVPNGTVIEKWNCTGYTTNTMVAGVWTPSGATLKPGEGAFIVNNSGASFNVTFTGTPRVPVLPPPLPCGCGQLNFLACQTNEIGTFENILGFSPPDAAQVYVYNGGFSVTTYDQLSQTWDNGAPALQPGTPAFFKIFACSTAPVVTCVSNKTVNGCSSWSFDTPTNITVNCYTNLAPTFSTVTNSGPCPLVTTRTWLITDVCGNTNTCSQTVTVNCCTNCCAGCTTNNYISYTNTLISGVTSYLADNLCQGTNNSLNEVLGLPLDGSQDGDTVQLWDPAIQSFGNVQIFNSFSGGWIDSSTGNSSTDTLVAGEGFVFVNNSGAAFPLVIRGCPPTCPPPCSPTTDGSLTLVGRLGLGTATWANLFSCPPPCGARMSIWNGASFTDYDYANGAWTPKVPILVTGTSAFVSVQPNANCLPCTNNLVVNGGFEVTSPAVPPNTAYNFLSATTGVPGWTTTAGNTLEVWDNVVNGLPAAAGTNHMEINAQSNDQTVFQVLTNLDTNCLATFFFNFTGRFGIEGSTYNNDFTVTLSSGNTVSGDLLSVDLDPVPYSIAGWTTFSFSLYPPPTMTIGFRGDPHYTNGIATEGGAHIDNVWLVQCCTNCITLTCSSDKAVQCGSSWSFDAPTNIVDTCCTNYSVTFGTVTNSGACPLVTTRTWLISDACGHSNT